MMTTWWDTSNCIDNIEIVVAEDNVGSLSISPNLDFQGNEVIISYWIFWS